ncbi:MAG TPA: hypothetical protein VGG64_00345 [Pirellulales bacterium]|jgi:hypothetical protein
MSKTKQAVWNGSPLHSIIESPHEYTVVRFDYHNDPDDWKNSHVDLVLRRQGEVRRLRFLRPQSLKIEEGFPSPTHGMIILDIRDRKWDGLNIEVADFEASPGKILFYAQDVVDLDRPN